ncbi:DNA repair exonuclease [Candidatus Fermentibacterales bacterium]|nr:DNA repair exonuclease [Candidatus Fermentibacterales bacterium]
MCPHNSIRLLFLSDTHLGYDMPRRMTGSVRPRRGQDFFESFDKALRPALDGQVDVVVHGGDLFFRSRVRPRLVGMVLDRVRKVVEAGVPFVVVPGNHERSSMPLPMLWPMEGIEVLSEPRTVLLDRRGLRVALGGFPYFDGDVRGRFPDLVGRTGLGSAGADIRLLCMHQLVEGATVGPSDYVFRGGPDVIPGAALPRNVAVVLCGHVHRMQVLTRDLRGSRLPSPVIYAGSTERTSLAERGEQKGYYILQLCPAASGAGRVVSRTFNPLDMGHTTLISASTEAGRPRTSTPYPEDGPRQPRQISDVSP